jgi:hypothetical protein
MCKFNKYNKKIENYFLLFFIMLLFFKAGKKMYPLILSELTFN